MINLKKYFSKISDNLKDLFKLYPVTLITVVFATLLGVILVDNKLSDSEILVKAFAFCIIFFFGSFFTENTFRQNLYKYIAYASSAVIAVFFTVWLFDTAENLAFRLLFGYCSILTLLSLFKIIKNNNISFSEYILNTFENTFFASITYLILNIGITLVTVVFTELLLDHSSWALYLREQVLLLGWFAVPAFINSITNVNGKNTTKFIKNLINFVLLPLVVISMLIIYLYIIKVIFFEGIPSNVIFRILAGLFVVAFPIWNMSSVIAEGNQLLSKLSKLLPYFFMPFLILEIYSLGVRIADCGITFTRYFGIAFLILQIVILVLTVIKNKPLLPHVFTCAAVIVFIAFISPFNFVKVSCLSQKHMLEKYFPAGTSYAELNIENKQKAYSAYKYLDLNDGKSYIPEYASVLENEYFPGYVDDNSNVDRKYLSFYNNDNIIDVTNYCKLIEASGYSSINTSKLELNSNDYYYKYEIDLNSLLEEAMNQNSLSSLYQNCIIRIDETTDFYISRLYISYNSRSREILSIDISGYILQK